MRGVVWLYVRSLMKSLKLEPPKSRARLVCERLRDAIIDGGFALGSMIPEETLAQSFGVSRTPVREAVLKLADEGLIEVFPQSGTFVARIPLDALPEATEIRKALERTTVRLAAVNASRSQVARLRACVERQRELCAARDEEGFHRADEEFHALIAEAAGYPGFWTITQQVKVQVDRCCRLTLPVPGHIGKVIGEHEAILESIAVHDEAGAVAALEAHLEGLRVTIHDLRHAAPQFFTGTAGTE